MVAIGNITSIIYLSSKLTYFLSRDRFFIMPLCMSFFRTDSAASHFCGRPGKPDNSSRCKMSVQLRWKGRTFLWKSRITPNSKAEWRWKRCAEMCDRGWDRREISALSESGPAPEEMAHGRTFRDFPVKDRSKTEPGGKKANRIPGTIW